MKNPDKGAPDTAPHPIAFDDLAGGFGHFAADAPAPASEAVLRDVAARMATDAPALRPDPLAAAFVQFALHDVCLPVWRDAAPAEGATLDRDALDAALVNLRRGSFDLDGVYGAETGAAPALLETRSPGKMRLAEGDGAVGLPWTGEAAAVATWAAEDAFALPPCPAERPALLAAERRNVGDPLLQKLHVAALRLHNIALEACAVPGAAPEASFRDARAELRFLLQWLLLNDAVPALASAEVVSATLEAKAPMFQRFAARRGRGVPPLPLDLVAVAGPLLRAHALEGGPDAAALERIFVLSARLGAPSGQSARRAMNAARGGRAAPLTDAEIAGGAAGKAIGRRLLDAAPLPVYLLREAAERGEAGRFGPLGAEILAEGLCGAVLKDPMSYWSRWGEEDGRWSPADCEIRMPDGGPIRSVADLLVAAGLG